MIRVTRCAEPPELVTVRASKLPVLRTLGRLPTSADIVGYKLVAEQLWKSQHHKCCYCEGKVPKSFNDVEHYRPKAEADRSPGSNARHGYWWLAYTWENLLFACNSCNRTGKNSKFPLAPNSVSLASEDQPPGNEVALLIDPSATVNPVEHIQFVCAGSGPSGPVYWWARPRGGSVIGNMTIDVCDLNRSDLLELRNDYVRDTVEKQISAILRAIGKLDIRQAKDEYKRAIGLLERTNPYVALAYDVMRSRIPSAHLKRVIGHRWPSPRQLR